MKTMTKNENGKTKTIQVYFPSDRIEEFNYCMATIRRVQSMEASKGNKCSIGDAFFNICQHFNGDKTG